MRAPTLMGAAAALFGVGLAASVLHARDVTRPLAPIATRGLMLHAGGSVRRLFLSFDALAADVYWIRTIQHYGRDRKSERVEGRFELLQPLLDLTTTLDPHFNLAYRFGAIFLSSEAPDGPGRSDQAIALLEKGLAANPTRWQYAHDIGFINYWYTGNEAEAARWFQRAAAMPGAPNWLAPLAAVTLAQGGDRQGARQLLSELVAANEPYVRAAAERGLAQLQALDEIDAITARVAAFRSAAAHDPASWADLVHAGLLPGVPLDPAGVALVYDAATHAVSLSTRSPLAPLPHMIARR